MKTVRNVKTYVAASIFSFAVCTAAADAPKDAVQFTPDDFKWKPSARVSGLEKAVVFGNDKSGPYIYRIKFPSNFKVQAHSHPDTRTYTIISGSWYIGWGKKFDESKLIALPAGSFYSEPANEPHFVMTKGEVVVQMSGNGPTAVNYIDPAHAPKKK